MKNKNSYSLDIPNIYESVKISYKKGELTLPEVAEELYKANIIHYINLDYACNLMENKEKTPKQLAYRIFDEMAFEVILETDDYQEALDVVYNYQSVLIDNLTDKVLKDFSC